MQVNKFLILATLLFIWSCSGYTVEEDKVYYVGWNEAQGKVKRHISADAATFKVLEMDRYAVDKDNVYYAGTRIDSADPATFMPLSEFIAKDKRHGYYGNTLIENSHGPTFELIDGNYTRDKQDVYYIQRPLGSSSPKSFEILQEGHGNWARDGVTYYYTGNKVPVADYASFRILDEDCFFAKDKYHVYNRDKILAGVDAETFRFLERCVGQDKFGCHNLNERCDCPQKRE